MIIRVVAVAATWLLFSGSLQTQEILAATAVGLATSFAGAALRRRAGHRQTGLRLWIRHLPGIAVQAVVDCWTLSVMLGRTLRGEPPRGAFRRVPFEVGDDDPADVGRRVLATIGTTLQPHSCVVGFNRERGEVLVHQLDPTPEEPIAVELRRRR